MRPSIKHNSGGLPLGKLNYIMAVIALVVSLLLIYSSRRSMEHYESSTAAMEDYIAWERSASTIKEATDYLTEQARNFVMTGEKKYIDNYFLEVNITRRRESALALLRSAGIGDYEKVADAVHQSEGQMAFEYYAMRLTISAYGYDPSEFPADLQSITLLARDGRLTRAEKQERAKQMVLDSAYLEKKAAIDEDMRAYRSSLEQENEARQAELSTAMYYLLENQQMLVFALILLFALLITMNTFLIINPLMRGVLKIRAEQPLSISGSYEFRYLAKTYNLMFEATQKKTDALAFEASHDKLTGLYNRVGYDNLLKTTDMSACALLLIDVDKFKNVNDTYGHDVGDRVLKRIATVLHESFRSGDFVCRIGGDEFATIMINTNSTLTELIRGKVERINDKLLHPTDDLPPISVSVGVAFGNEQHGTGSIIKDADLALYVVKEHGRCGVEFFVPAFNTSAALPEA